MTKFRIQQKVPDPATPCLVELVEGPPGGAAGHVVAEARHVPAIEPAATVPVVDCPGI